MFNVSALLLDDALKPSTPLTNGAINENKLIFDEVKAHKNYAKFLGHPDVIPAEYEKMVPNFLGHPV